MSDHDRNVGDIGPGVMEDTQESLRGAVFSYSIGLVLSVLLTGAAFTIGYSGLVWRPGLPSALIVLAVAQIGVHLVFFLHITTDPDNTNNVLALAFGVLIVVLLIGGSVWIMEWLNYRMMIPTPGGMGHGGM
ncbi:MAG TPA: cytochrome o ubiquinol oxidase subunit IV [Acetobacteraceae bacterium]|nr:cytochrome o ubiquinol oxidase subunit IV [Acetobacteraceae bacterium]